MGQLIKKAEQEENQKSTELQPMIQVQVPEGVEPGAKLSVQAANGSMVDIVVPVGALPNTTLQVPMPMPGKNEAQAAGSKEKKAQHTLYKRRCQCFCAAVALLFFITVFQITMLFLAGPFANPLAWTVRHRAPGTTRRRLHAHEIPPPEMFSGVDLHGPDHEVVLDIYKAHWDIQRRKVRAGHKRFLGGGNTTSEDTTLESTCKNAVFNVAEHMEDVTNCKCVDKDKNYFTCTEEDVPEEQEEEKKEKKETPGDPYICPEFSKYESPQCDGCAWCKNNSNYGLIIVFLIITSSYAYFTALLLLIESGKFLYVVTCRCFNCCCNKTAPKNSQENSKYEVSELGLLSFHMKGKDNIIHSVILLLQDAIAARKLFYQLESKREVLKRDIRNERAW